MVNYQRNQSTQNLSVEDKAYYLSQLHAAYEAAIIYDGSEGADERLYEPLNNLDQFVMRANDGQIDEGLERAFSNTADPEWAKNHPHTVRALMEEAAKFYARMESANSFEAIINGLDNSGAYVVRTDAVYIETDDMAAAEGASENPESFEIRTQPRLAMLIKNLKEIGIYTDDLAFYVGQVRDDMMRQYPYVVVQIPRLGKEIAVCDQVGEATFVGHKIHDVAVWEYLTKQQMNDRDDFDRIVFRDEAQWWDELHGHLRGDAPQVAKTAKKDVAKFARKKPPLDIDLIKGCIKAHYEATGEWVTARMGVVSHGVYKGRESWTNIHSAIKEVNAGRGGRGLPPGHSLPSLKAEVALENDWEYKNIHEPGSLTIKDIKACIIAHYEAEGDWPNANTGVVKYGVYKDSETWRAINVALHQCGRSLPKGHTPTSLMQEIAREKKWLFVHKGIVPDLDIDQVKLSIAAHFYNTDGEWVKNQDRDVLYGPYADQGEKWYNISTALAASKRGLTEKFTLGGLKNAVAAEYGWEYQGGYKSEDLTVESIKACIEATYLATGKWVVQLSGYVLYGPYAGKGETWGRIVSALHSGGRGLPEKTHSLPSMKKELAAEHSWPLNKSPKAKKLTHG